VDPSTPAIDVRGLTKSYGKTVAVAGIDLQIASGEVFAPLGPNGAQAAHRHPVAVHRRRAVPDRGRVHRHVLGYYPHPRPVDEVVELVGLTGKRDSRVAKLSGGQQRRLDVAIALEAIRICSSSTNRSPASTRRPGTRPGRW
jgi:ABC-2 type transport system ATP-binding protein